MRMCSISLAAMYGKGTTQILEEAMLLSNRPVEILQGTALRKSQRNRENYGWDVETWRSHLQASRSSSSYTI